MTRNFHTFTTAACLALCAFGLTACTGGDESKTGKTGKAAKEAPKKGSDSPEDVYNKAKALFESEPLDTQAFAELWSPSFCRETSGTMLLMGGMMVDKDKKESATKDLEALMTKHGVKKPEGKVNLSKMKEAVEPMMAEVSDPVACWKDVMDWLMANSSRMKKNMKNKPIGDLKDIKIKGDFAMGESTKLKEDKEVKEPMYFRKVDDRWYLDGTPEAKKAFRDDEAKTDK